MNLSIADAVKKIAGNVASPNSPSVEQAFAACEPILSWINYLYTSEKTGVADEFLNGFRSSVVETIFCMATGLSRMALFGMRAQIDICFSWLYFKDHAVEYRKVKKTSEGFMLKGAVYPYLEEYEPKFKSRFAALLSCSKRQEKDPYKLLSAHVHSQSLKTLPVIASFEDIISAPDISSQLIEIQNEVSEYIGDVLFSCFGSKWAAIPKELVDGIKSRLDSQKLSTVFS